MRASASGRVLANRALRNADGAPEFKRRLEAAEARLMRGGARGPLDGIPFAHKDIVGTAGILLNFHVPLVAAQQFLLLEHVFPGRIDAGQQFDLPLGGLQNLLALFEQLDPFFIHGQRLVKSQSVVFQNPRDLIEPQERCFECGKKLVGRVRKRVRTQGRQR